MKSNVFFSDLKVGFGKTLLDKLAVLLDRANLKGKIDEKDLVAIKLHFGEKGNTAFIRPLFLRRVVDEVRKHKGKPFLTDTNTLYVGTRAEAVSHLTTAYENGFATSVVGAPLLIADGLRGNSAVNVKIDKPLFKTVSIAHADPHGRCPHQCRPLQGSRVVRIWRNVEEPGHGMRQPGRKIEPAFGYLPTGQGKNL